MATWAYSQPAPRERRERSRDSMPDPVDPAEPLDVQVDQLAGPLTLVGARPAAGPGDLKSCHPALAGAHDELRSSPVSQLGQAALVILSTRSSRLAGQVRAVLCRFIRGSSLGALDPEQRKVPRKAPGRQPDRLNNLSGHHKLGHFQNQRVGLKSGAVERSGTCAGGRGEDGVSIRRDHGKETTA